MFISQLNKIQYLALFLSLTFLSSCAPEPQKSLSHTFSSTTTPSSPPSSTSHHQKNISDYYPGFSLRKVSFGIEFDNGHLKGILNVFKDEKNFNRVLEYMEWAGVHVYADRAYAAEKYNIRYLGENTTLRSLWKQVKNNPDVAALSIEKGTVILEENSFKVEHPSIIFDTKNPIKFETLFHEFIHFLIGSHNVNLKKMNIEEAKYKLIESNLKFISEIEQDNLELQRIIREYENNTKFNLKNLFKYLKPGDHTLPYKMQLKKVFNAILLKNYHQLEQLYEFSKCSYLEEIVIESLVYEHLTPLGIITNDAYFNSEITEFYNLIQNYLDNQLHIVTILRKLDLLNQESNDIVNKSAESFFKIDKEVQELIKKSWQD